MGAVCVFWSSPMGPNCGVAGTGSRACQRCSPWASIPTSSCARRANGATSSGRQCQSERSTQYREGGHPRNDSNDCTQNPLSGGENLLGECGLCQLRWATQRQHGFEGVQQLRVLLAIGSRRKADGLKAVSELVIAWTASRASAVPTATNSLQLIAKPAQQVQSPPLLKARARQQ